MLFKNSEEKRSTVWRTVLTASSVLIVILAVFLIAKLFTNNPLAGTWVSDEGEMTLTFSEDGDRLQVEDGTVSAETGCSIDKSNRVLTVHVSDDAVKEQAEAAGEKVTEAQLHDLLDDLEGTYEYNIEKTTLTLTEREYGSQMVFEKN